MIEILGFLLFGNDCIELASYDDNIHNSEAQQIGRTKEH